MKHRSLFVCLLLALSLVACGTSESSGDGKADEAQIRRVIARIDSATASKIEVDGTDASAVVSFDGGRLDGQTVRLAFANEDGRWKDDGFKEFVKLDRGALARSFAKALSSTGLSTRAELACIGDAVRAAPQEEIEEALRDHPTSPSVLFSQIERCHTGTPPPSPFPEKNP